jgi:hypothetical protein
LGLNLRKKQVKCHIWGIAVYDAASGEWYLESFKMYLENTKQDFDVLLTVFNYVSQ